MNLEELALQLYPDMTSYPSGELERQYYNEIQVLQRQAFIAGAKAKEEMDVELLRDAFSAGSLLAAYYSGDPVKKPSFDTFEQWLQQKKGGEQ